MRGRRLTVSFATNTVKSAACLLRLDGFCRRRVGVCLRRRGIKFKVKTSFAHVAQSAERVLGKDEVTSSNLVMGSINEPGKNKQRRNSNG